MDDFDKGLEFEWDEGNIAKSWIKHKVTNNESEEVFFDEFAFITRDVKHSTTEPRYQLLGVTKERRKLTIYFTVRVKKIRIISARPMSRKERKQYEKVSQKN